MENPNPNPNPSPSKDSTTPKSPSDQDSDPIEIDSNPNPNPTNEGSDQGDKMEEDIIIDTTALDVLAQVSSNELDEIAHGGVGCTAAMVLEMNGEKVVVETGSTASQRKRKSIDMIENLPTGKATCPICRVGFFTMSAAFTHMIANHTDPNPNYLGRFPFPILTPSFTTLDDDGDDGVANMEVSGTSDHEANSVPASAPESAQENIKEKKKILGFDLNLPPPEEEDEE